MPRTPHLAGPWAQTPPPLPITPDNNPEGEPIGAMQGSLEDMQGRFNLNSLARLAADGVTEDPLPLQQFQRLVVSVGVEPKWAGLARDWLDQDDVVGNPDGAEDAVYTSQTPPYRTGNWPMMSPTELMNLPGFGADRYRKIAPYVTALPSANTESQSVHGPRARAREPRGRPEWRMVEQSGGAHDQPQDGLLSRTYDLHQCRHEFCRTESDGKPRASPSVCKANTSSSRRALTLGTTEFTLYSLLYRGGSNKVTPLLRSFGTP